MSDDEKDPEAGSYTGAARSAPYPLSRLAPAFSLVDVAREIAEADARVAATAGTQLELIAEQIRSLQEKAHAVLAAARRDAELHRVESRFRKQPGGVYHLYRRENGTPYFSMLSPADWSGAPPHPYEGSYRLEADLSWSQPEAAPRDRAEIARMLVLLTGGDLCTDISPGRSDHCTGCACASLAHRHPSSVTRG